MKRVILGAAALLATPASIAQAPDWSSRATATPSGAYVIGNPAAKAKLVEYLSYTCPACATVVAESSAPLKRGYLATGRASLEVRHALRDPLDFAAALLARCEGPDKFLGHSNAIFATQSTWYAKGRAYAQANAARLQSAPISSALVDYAEGSGLSALMRQRGLAPARINACLADPGQQAQLSSMTETAWQEIKGTPSFKLNGTVLAGNTWTAVKPALDAAIK